MTSIHQRFLSYQATLQTSLGERVSIDGLTGDYRIFQRLKGHRHSTDDATTSWYALQQAPRVSHALDLGTGIGSVGLALLWGPSGVGRLTCIEAQQQSFTLLQANIQCNELSDRVHAIHGDLRELNLGVKFPLVTGSPPYFPVTAGVVAPDSQKAHARFELRGDVSDYARAALRHLTDDGVFVYCFPYQQKERGIELVRSTGLHIVKVRDVIPHRNKPPLFSVYCARITSTPGLCEEPPLIIADESGRYSEEMRAIQRARGFGEPGTNSLG